MVNDSTLSESMPSDIGKQYLYKRSVWISKNHTVSWK